MRVLGLHLAPARWAVEESSERRPRALFTPSGICIFHFQNVRSGTGREQGWPHGQRACWRRVGIPLEWVLSRLTILGRSPGEGEVP